jgi:aspartate aminotransferase
MSEINMTTKDLIDEIPESSSMRMGRIAREKREQIDLINLGIGDPFFTTPKNIIDSAYGFMVKGKTHYESAQGVDKLRIAISNYLKNRFDIRYDSSEIIVTPGAKQGIFYAFFLLIEAGMKVGLFEPSWLGYVPSIRLSGGIPVFFNLDNGGFTDESLTNLSEEKVDLLIVNNPTNPSGKVWDKKELDLLADYCAEENTKVISDEVYHEIVYEKEFVSLGKYEGIGKDLVLAGSFSKTLSMTGWRLGYVCVKDKKMRERLTKLQQIIATCPSSFAQFAVADTLEASLGRTEEMVGVYRKNRDLLFETLNNTRLKPTLPDGTFYMWVDVGEDGEDFAVRLLNDLGIIVVPGRDYGENTQRFVRMSFGIPTERIEEACQRFENEFGK